MGTTKWLCICCTLPIRPHRTSQHSTTEHLGPLNHQKEFVLGILIGLGSTLLGCVLVIWLLTNQPIGLALENLIEQRRIGSLISLGAIPNLFLFFGFLRQRKDAYSKGILMATFIVAIATLIIKITLGL